MSIDKNVISIIGWSIFEWFVSAKKNNLVYSFKITVIKIMSSKPSVPNSLNEHWMPFSSNRDFKANPRLIVEAKGVYLKNHQDRHK